MDLKTSFGRLGGRSAETSNEETAMAYDTTEVRLVKGPERTKGEDMFGRSEEKAKEKEREKMKEPATSFGPPRVEEKPPVARERERIEPLAAQPAPVGEVHAYFGKGSRISGKLNFEGTVRVDGKVEGEIYAKDTLIIGESADVTAEIRATNVTIRGLVRGDVHALARIEILPPGRLYGNISTPSLVVGEGVIFEGSCTMESQTKKDDRKVTPLGQTAKADRSQSEAAG